MHLLLDTRAATPHFPGIGRYVSNLARGLPAHLDKDDSLTLIFDSYHTPEWLHAKQRGNLGTIPTTISPFSWAQQWQLPRLLRQSTQSSHTLYHSPYYLMPYRPGLPTVLTVYDLIPILYPRTVSARARLLFRLTTTLALHAASAVIAISLATRSDYLWAFKTPPTKLRAIPLASDESFKPQPASEIERVRVKYSLPPKFMLYLGINKPHKNLPRLVQAWKDVHTTGWQLLIGGAWDERYPEARQQSVGVDSIRFLGPLPEADLPALYAAADWFIFPSLYEGFGLPVLEAMACGTPVICSNTSSLPEITGDAAITFDPQRASDIAESIRQAVDNAPLRQDCAARSLAQAAQFTWQRTIEETLKVYREVVSGKTRDPGAPRPG